MKEEARRERTAFVFTVSLDISNYLKQNGGFSMSTATKQTFSSTKALNRTLGKKELMGIAIGQIIGAGVMSMMGVAIAMTGRSANLAFMLSAVFTMCTFFPSIFITSCIRMRGGAYTQFAVFAGDK